MKTLNVVAAIILKDNRILAAQRGYGEFKDGWEFPGGKVEAGESEKAALERELMEELRARVEIQELFCQVSYSYPNFQLKMNCYLCVLTDSEIELKEHEAARWLESGQLDEVAWLPADKGIIEKLKAYLKKPE